MKKNAIIAIALAAALTPAYASAACTNLSSTGGPTIDLQRYLQSAGYLSATPNGVYGPATTAAVKKFQAINGITQTGTVGPITRLAIQMRSCSATAATIPTPTPTPTTPASSAASIIVKSPLAGESLTIGSTATITWTGPAGTIYSVILEDATSTSQGFVAYRTLGNSFDWKVGEVDANNTQITVAPGTYRVRVQDAAQGTQSTDRISGVFTIVGTPITLSSVMPQSGPADGKTSVALYGSGFTQLTNIDFYGYGLLKPAFVSQDGKILVFTVPRYAYQGAHSFSVVNSYQSSTYTSTSADAQFIVTQ